MRLRRVRIPRETEPCRVCGGTGHVIAAGPAGEILRGARQTAGLGLRQLAKALGVSATHVSDVENGRRKPSEAFLKRYLGLVGSSQPHPKD